MKYLITNKDHSQPYGGTMGPYGDIVVCGGRSHPTLVESVCRHLEIFPSPITFTDFSNGNVKVVLDNVRHQDVFVIQTGARGGVDNRFFTKVTSERRAAIFERFLAIDGLSPDETMFVTALLNAASSFGDLASLFCNRDLMELLIIVDALRSASAGRITVVMPYMFYVRSDKKEEGRISVTAKLVAKLIECAGAHRVLVMDLHASQIQSFFDIPTDQLFAEPSFFEFIRRHRLENMVVVTGDEGNVKPSRRIARLLGNLPVVIVHKMRWDDTETADDVEVIGDVEGKICLLVDDETLTGGTLLPAIRILKNRGAREVIVFLAHFIASNGAVQLLTDSSITSLVTTNTIPLICPASDKIQICDVSSIFARAIRRIHDGRSISDLIQKLRENALTI
ncbi:ribose-phosphate diphosphokinase [Patescibacteria group bacterium]